MNIICMDCGKVTLFVEAIFLDENGVDALCVECDQERTRKIFKGEF